MGLAGRSRTLKLFHVFNFTVVNTMAMSHPITTVVHTGVASPHLHILTKSKRLGKQLETPAQIPNFYLTKSLSYFP